MDLSVFTILLTTACLLSGEAVGNETEAIDDNGSTICYGDLGCFGKNNSFFSLNLFPESPDTINTMFRLFTRANIQDIMFQMLWVDNITSIRNSSFDHSKPTKIVVHGYHADGLKPWMLELYGANPEDFHIIGHSLGAHIGGYAGERVPNLGGITGLDPAALNFQYTDTRIRLDPTDAKFVDVIHTDGKSIIQLGLGMIQPIGHVDYYPNGGLSQPGCSLLNMLLTGPSVKHVVCSHLRAYDYFIESINSTCPFLGYRCQSYADFKRGVCIPCSDGRCGYMGYHADRAKPPVGTTNVKYFLDTGSSKPFCRVHYQTKVSFGNLSNSRTERGKFMVNLNGSNGQLGEKALTDRYMDIEPGKTYAFVVTSINDLGTVNSATMSWYRSAGRFENATVYMENLEIVNGESSGIVKLCGQNAAIEAGHTQYFTTKC